MRHAGLRESLGKLLRFMDTRCPDQYRLPLGAPSEDISDDGLMLLFKRIEDKVLIVVADQRPVGRYDLYIAPICRTKLLARRPRGPGHSGELLITPKKRLVGHLRQSRTFNNLVAVQRSL